MASATAPIDTPEKPGVIRNLPVAAATVLFLGALIATNAAGNAVKAADIAGLRVQGRAEDSADNSAGVAGDLTINVKEGVFLFDNSATNAVDADDIGKDCFVEDDHTVAETSTNKVIAGKVWHVEPRGVWVDTRKATFVPVAVALSGTAATDITAIYNALVAQGLLR